MIARIRRHFRRRANPSTSSFPRRRKPTGRKWTGWPAQLGGKIPGPRRPISRTSRTATPSIASLNCSICPTCPRAKTIIDLAPAKRIRLTPPPKPLFEEKMLFALLWNRNLHGFWRQELGEGFFDRLPAPGSLHLDRGPRAPAAARRHPGIEPDRLAPAQGPFAARARVDPESLRLLGQGLGRARRSSRQRSFRTPIGRRRG